MTLLKRKTKIKLKLKLEKFIKYELWQHIIVLSFVFFCAWLFNKYVEAIMFCISHTVIRFSFDKQYHCTSIAMCLLLTLTITFFGIMAVLPTSISLLSSIPLAFIISYVGYIAQDRIDRQHEIAYLQDYANNLEARLANKDIYTMSEEELYEHCRSRGLPDDECKIAKLIIIDRLKGCELYDAIGYSERQTKRKRKKILETIK